MQGASGEGAALLGGIVEHRLGPPGGLWTEHREAMGGDSEARRSLGEALIGDSAGLGWQREAAAR